MKGKEKEVTKMNSKGHKVEDKVLKSFKRILSTWQRSYQK